MHMKALVRTSILAGVTVVPLMAVARQYRRAGLYTVLTTLSYLNHRGRCPSVVYADRVVALYSVVDLWERCSGPQRKVLLSAISLYLLRHLTKNPSYHAAAHLLFVTTTVWNAVEGVCPCERPPRSVIALCLLVLGLLPTQ